MPRRRGPVAASGSLAPDDRVYAGNPVGMVIGALGAYTSGPPLESDVEKPGRRLAEVGFHVEPSPA